MGKGKRYNDEQKLNVKKVIAVIVAVVVLIMFIYVIRILLENAKNIEGTSGTSYYTVFRDNKFGVINQKAEMVIEPAYQELVIIPNSGRDIFIITYDVDYNNGTYKTKVLNSKNEEIFTQYKQVMAIDNYDEQGNIWYEDNVLKVEQDGKYGLINFSGKEILKCEYDEIQSLKSVTNSLLITKDGKVGIIDNAGKKVVDTKYVEILPLNKDYKSGYIVKNEEGKYGVVDITNKTILDIQYDEIKQVSDNGLYVAKKDSTWKVLEKNDKVVLEDMFDDIKDIRGSNIIYIKSGHYGVIAKDGTQVIPDVYEDIKFSLENSYIVKQEGRYGIVNKNNEPVIDCIYYDIYYTQNTNFIEAQTEEVESELFDSAFNLLVTGIVSELNVEKGYLKVRVNNEYKYYNLKLEEKGSNEILMNNNLLLSKKDGKYGFVDKEGNVIVEHIYDDATEQNSFGYAGVKKGTVWGSINKDGKLCIDPVYILDENLKINFIGKWHLAKDLNMNYYEDK